MFREELVVAATAREAERELAAAVLETLRRRFGAAPLYARVDMLSAARGEPLLLGLEAVEHPFDQVGRVDRVVVLTSQAFDFPSTKLPDNVVYAGPEIGDPDWVEQWESPWPDNDVRPLVLVGFSTTFQDQTAALSRVIAALGTLDVRAVVTAGPSIDMAALALAANVHVCRSAPHNQLLSEASAVVTHCGHGTVIRTLAAGVPMVCMPMGRDQNDNAARVTARQAGVRISPKASVGAIRRAVIEVLENPAYYEGAKKLGKRVAEDAGRSLAVEILEEIAMVPGGKVGSERSGDFVN